ncbi:c-type cytochrome domain-containing protein [Candidatus Rariloculus sp.]|uniref:c-type cytochrome domain-containing protein n=1 Tax=Candidatus Rariloculus sp. TaxID=3101265 RepID=UPI003D0EA688
MEFIFFIGRFHVLALHLPIGIVLLTIAVELLSRRARFRPFEPVVSFLWAVSAVTAIVTAALGYLHYLEGGFEGLSATLHMIFGTSVAAVATLGWWLHAGGRTVHEMTRHGIGAALVVLVALAGHYGGNLTHGSSYLAEYAPGPLRALAGLEPRRPPVTSLAMADPFLDVVRPVLRQRCSGCHGDDRQRGGLNMSTYDALLAGGETGPAIVPGNAGQSEIYYRTTLASDHESFMPAEGRTPLTETQIEVIRWWIDAGAPTGTTLASLDVSAVESQLAAVLRLGDEAVTASSEPVAADADALAALFAAGFQARQRSQGDPSLTVSLAHSPTALIGAAHLEALAEAREQIAELNLRRAGVGDEHLAAISEIENLTHLSLAENNVSDEGLGLLASLGKLESLNLTGNPAVGDAGVAALAGLSELKTLYLWGSSVTDAGVDELRAQLPSLTADLGTAFAVE